MKIWILVAICAFVSNTQAQSSPPDWYLKEISSEIGIWITDNSKYSSDQEQSDQYAIDWKLGSDKVTLTGRLYGLKGGKEIGTFWTFRKYWDGENSSAYLEQVSLNGTRGIGPYTKTGDFTNELKQVFTNPDGTSRTVGHRTTYLSNFCHVGSSYIIDERGNWIPDRSYTWIKESMNLDEKPLLHLEYMVGKWQAAPADSSFRSVITYRYSQNKNLLLSTNQLFDREGNELGSYEGAYYAQNGELGYYLTGPDGEYHVGEFQPNDNQIVHMAQISPGDKVKTYKSIMEFKLGKLYYHSKYSNSEIVPEHVPLNNPLIYLRLDKE